MGWLIGILCYFLGGVTFIPLVLWVTHIYMSLPSSPPPAVTSVAQEVDVTTCHNYGTKKGWIRLSSNYQVKSPTNGTKKKQQAKENGEGYGVLKQGILKVYTNELQQHCQWIVDLNDYEVSIYPPGRQEHTLFSRSVALRLQRKSTASTTIEDTTKIQDNVIYFSCNRPIDKEDWYFAFISMSSSALTSTPSSKALHAIPFDPMAVASLITFVGKQKQEESEANQQQIPWFNAILGRTFLGIYRTKYIQQAVLETLAKKTKKMKTPGFLGDIQVRSVDLGHAMPFVTQPTLVALQPDGTLVLDAKVVYTGGFKVVVEANVGGTFSIRVPLVLSLTLRSLSGMIRFKIKPPPSNRYWIGFCTMPTMKWSIVPAVSNCNVKLSMVTKIIEGKIKRMMTDNMVLPNMEDIPFAKSDGRGGIFHDTTEQQQDDIDINSSDEAVNSTANEDDLDTSLQQSFTINSTDEQNSGSSTPSMDERSAMSSSVNVNGASTPSSGRWSKFFSARRRKNTGTSNSVMSPSSSSSTAVAVGPAAVKMNEGSLNTKMKYNSQNHYDQARQLNTDEEEQQETDTMKQIVTEKDRYNQIYSDNAGENALEDDKGNAKENDNSDESASPYHLSPSSTVAVLVHQTSSSSSSSTLSSTLSSSTLPATELSTVTTSPVFNEDPAKDDDNASLASTKSSRRKRIYNAAGYIFAKGKVLANDLREHRQQDLQIKRQQSLLHYSDQLQDIRRRCSENTRRLSTASVSSSSSVTVDDSVTSHSTTRKNSIPPLHLIHDSDGYGEKEEESMPPALPLREPTTLNNIPPLPPRRPRNSTTPAQVPLPPRSDHNSDSHHSDPVTKGDACILSTYPMSVQEQRTDTLLGKNDVNYTILSSQSQDIPLVQHQDC